MASDIKHEAPVWEGRCIPNRESRYHRSAGLFWQKLQQGLPCGMQTGCIRNRDVY